MCVLDREGTSVLYSSTFSRQLLMELPEASANIGAFPSVLSSGKLS